MSDKNVLVLFYDRKDKLRPAQIEGKEWALVDAIKLGFAGTAIKYTVRTASPRHEPWLVQYFMNEKKYDAMLIVGGLSCSLDIPNMLMEELYDNREIRMAPRDWKNAVIEENHLEGKITQKHEIKITEQHLKSNYFDQERRIPIIGIPTADPYTYGEIAFASMLMSSRPSEAACVGVEQGYQGAKLVTRVLTNEWNDVKIIVPEKNRNSKGAGYGICPILDKEFKPYEDCGITFNPEAFNDYRHNPLKPWKPKPNVLHICVYDDFTQLKEISELTDFVIGVAHFDDQEFAPGGKIDFRNFVKRASELSNVIHVRPAVPENAAKFAAQCLALHSYEKKIPGKDKTETVWLKPSRFPDLRRKKSWPNVQEFLKTLE